MAVPSARFTFLAPLAVHMPGRAQPAREKFTRPSPAGWIVHSGSLSIRKVSLPPVLVPGWSRAAVHEWLSRASTWGLQKNLRSHGRHKRTETQVPTCGGGTARLLPPPTAPFSLFQGGHSHVPFRLRRGMSAVCHSVPIILRLRGLPVSAAPSLPQPRPTPSSSPAESRATVLGHPHCDGRSPLSSAKLLL